MRKVKLTLPHVPHTQVQEETIPLPDGVNDFQRREQYRNAGIHKFATPREPITPEQWKVIDTYVHTVFTNYRSRKWQEAQLAVADSLAYGFNPPDSWVPGQPLPPIPVTQGIDTEATPLYDGVDLEADF